MNTKEVLSILHENILLTKETINTKFDREEYLNILTKQLEILQNIKQMIEDKPDKQEIFKMGLTIISLSYMIDESAEMPSYMIN